MAGRKIKGEVMTETEMIQAGIEKRQTSKIYKQQAKEITDESLKQRVAQGYEELSLMASNRKIDMNNVEMVKTVSLQYTKACADVVCFPSMSGLARALGVCRASLYYWMNHKGDTETGQWLQVCRDLFSDVLAEASLRGDCNPIVGIFLQKAIYGLRDNIAVDITPSDNYFEENANDDFKQKYRRLIRGEP